MSNKNKGNKSNNQTTGNAAHVMMTFEVNHTIVNNNNTVFINNDFGFVFVLTQFFFDNFRRLLCYIAEKYCIYIAPFHKVGSVPTKP